MPIDSPKMKVTLAPPNDPRWTSLFQEIEANLEIDVPDGFLVGVITNTLPIDNVGLVIYNGALYLWDDISGQYAPLLSQDYIGSITDFAFDEIDLTKFLICDGSAIPRAAPYDLLFNRIGTTWGTGDGQSTFNIPECRGRSRMGAGIGTIPSVGGAPAGTLTARTLAQLLGEETHALTPTEVPGIDTSGTSKPAKTGTDVGISASSGAAHNTIHPVTVTISCIRFA